jgi:trigger factor
VPEALSEVLIKENVASVGEPQIDEIALVKGQPLRFVATTQVVPDFTLTDYKGWQFVRRVPEVTEAQIDEALENLRARQAILQTVEGRAVQEGDVVILDYTGSVDGQPLPGFAGSKVSIEVASGQSFPEIEQGLVGMEQGSEKMIPVHFPEDFRNAAVAGKVGQCRVLVTEIKEKHLPNLDDDFARGAYDDVDSLAALRTKLGQELEKIAWQRADATVQQEILTRLIAAHPIDVPEVLLNEELRRIYLQHKRQENDGQLTEADYAVAPESLREPFGEQALESLRGQLILRHIAAAAEITVDTTEIEAEVAALAARTAQNPEALKGTMERNGTLRVLEASLLEAKVFAKIMADMHITDIIVREDTAVSQAEQVSNAPSKEE